MNDVKNPPIELDSDGETHYLFTEKHTIADIIRFAIKQGGKEDVKYILDQELLEESNNE